MIKGFFKIVLGVIAIVVLLAAFLFITWGVGFLYLLAFHEGETTNIPPTGILGLVIILIVGIICAFFSLAYQIGSEMLGD